MPDPAAISEFELASIVDDAGYPDSDVIAVAVVNPDESVISQVRGTLADGRPMSTSTQVYGASLTKQIVAMCIARLVNAKQLDPDRPISTWISGLPEWSDQITVRHLLHHVSGLPEEDPLIEKMNELELTHRTSDAMLTGVATFPSLATAPGAEHHYSNIGYIALGRIVEIVSGTSLIDHIGTTVFKPLGMGQSRLWSGPDLHPPDAYPLDPNHPTPHSLGDGGMWTTADDLTKWIVAMNADTFGTRDQMMTRIELNDGTPLDYAWGILVTQESGVTICSHGGGWHGSISHMAWLPDRCSGYIAFTRNGGEPLSKVTAELRQRLTA